MTKRGMGRFALGAVVFGLLASRCGAGVVTFVGEDLQPVGTPSAWSNSSAAAAAFDIAAAALNPVSIIDFEGASLGSFASLAAPGVTLTGADYLGNSQTVRNTSNFPANPSLDGTNTTLGGSTFVEVQGGTLTFTFDQPTQFFGTFLTGVQTAFFHDTINFTDGSSQSITLAGVGTSSSVGEVAFIGFTDAGKFISSVTLDSGNRTLGADFVGVDDVRVQVATSTPLPSSALGGLILLGGLGIANARRRFARA